MEISIVQLITPVLVIGLRVSGLMIFAPFFGSAVVPVRVKAVLAIAITAVISPAYYHRVGPVAAEQWPMLVGTEVLFGISMGLATNLVFEAAQIAGQILSVQMGYSLVNILDPTTQVETTVMSLFHQTIAMLIFLQLNVHHWILRGVANSFEYLPVGTVTLSPRFTQALLHEVAIVLEVGVQIAAPVLIATIVADFALALLSKAAPQMPVMLVGTAAKSVVGLLVLSAVLRYWPHLFERYFERSIAYSETLLHLAR